MDELAELCQVASTVARDAAQMLLDALHQQRTSVTTKSSTTDMVTEMDRKVEELVVGRLLAARPHDGVVGEEGTAHVGTSGVDWVVDPLDGTTNYLYRHPGFGVSIAARRNGETVVGVVADPTHQALFDAVAGGGARCNGIPLSIAGRTDAASPPRATAASVAAASVGTTESLVLEPGSPLSQALVATGFSYDPARRQRQAAVLTHVLPRVRDIRRMGAAAVDLCSVAMGRVDAFYEKGLADWDLAAGALIASEAGAVVGDLDGGPPSNGFVLAAPRHLFEPLRALLVDAGAALA